MMPKNSPDSHPDDPDRLDPFRDASPPAAHRDRGDSLHASSRDADVGRGGLDPDCPPRTDPRAVNSDLDDLAEKPLGSRNSEVAVEFLRTAYPSLVRTARAIVGTNDAEDIVQQALIDVFGRFPDFQGLEFPTGYLRICVIRLAWRHQAQLPNLSNSVLSEALEAEERVGGDIADVIPLLHQLAPKQRACVFLNVFYGFSDREIATLLSCRPVTVRTQISRGLRALGMTITQSAAQGS